MFLRGGVIIGLVLIAGCASPLFSGKNEYARQLAQDAGFKIRRFQTNDFVITGFQSPHTLGAKVLDIYIEGDGNAFLSSSRPSSDPTPKNPVSLKLAIEAASNRVGLNRDAAIYLGRPCQYLEKQDPHLKCDVRYWTIWRYAPEVVSSFNAILDRVKVGTGARKLRLIGYSGGGVVAALLASTRSDVESLVTIAAPVDLDAWVSIRRLSPLSGSLNPAEQMALRTVPQVHFVGGDDERIPPAIARSYANRIGLTDANIITVRDMDHDDDWDDIWPMLMKQASNLLEP